MALFGASRAALGLDIGPDQEGALVELVDRGRRVELATYALFSRPAGDSVEEAARRVEEAISRAQVSADSAAFSLPSRRVFSAALTLPDMPAEQRTRAINFKAKHIIPATPAEVKLSFVQHRRPDGSLEVYLTAIPKQLIAWYWQLAKRVGLEVERLEPEIFSLIRSHEFEPGTTTLLCSVRYDMTFHVVTDSSPIASRTLEYDGTQLDNRATATEIARQVRHLIGDRTLSRVILTGPGATAPHSAERLASVLDHQVEVTNPWHHLAYPVGLERVIGELGPRLATAIGLARCRIPHKL